MSEQQPTDALWRAVDAITQPTTRRIFRDATGVDLAVGVVCHVAAHEAATVSHGVVPSLWEQAEMALTPAGASGGGSNSSPSSARSLADLTLMEIMATIRETVVEQLLHWAVRPRPGLPAQLRQWAAYVVTNHARIGSDPIEWWTYRVEQWQRLLATYLRAVETETPSRRLRGTACPLCKTKHVMVEDGNGGEPLKQPPIIIDFQDGMVRAARCEACGATWFRGDDLHELADLVNPPRDTPADDVASA